MLNLRLDERDEQGMSVIELTIASMILMIVLAVFFSGLISLTNSEKHASDVVTNEQNVRFVLTKLAKDIRSSNPLVTFRREEHVFEPDRDDAPARPPARSKWCGGASTPPSARPPIKCCSAK